MKAILRTAAAVAALILAPLAEAETWFNSTITQLYPLADGNFVLIFATDSPACTSPTTPDYYYIVVGQNGMTQEGAKKLFAAASMAFALGKPVWAVFDESTSNCYINRLAVVQ